MWIQIALMAHFTHPKELETPAVQHAVKRIRDTGINIRSQSPVMKQINDSAGLQYESSDLYIIYIYIYITSL